MIQLLGTCWTGGRGRISPYNPYKSRGLDQYFKDREEPKPVKIGDFVAVQYERGDPVIGVVIDPEKQMHQLNAFSVPPKIREQIIADPMPHIIAVRIGEWKTDIVFLAQCRKLTGKEIFKIKLEGTWHGLFT